MNDVIPTEALRAIVDENRHLKGTIDALREQLVLASMQQSQAVEAATLAQQSELNQLRQTATELRNKLELSALQMKDEAEQVRAEMSREVRQLHETSRTLRDNLERLEIVKNDALQRAEMESERQKEELRLTAAALRVKNELLQKEMQESLWKAEDDFRKRENQLANTISALRDELEQLRMDKEDTVQKLTIESGQRIQQLEKTITKLRDELEQLKIEKESALQALNLDLGHRIADLEKSVSHLRETLTTKTLDFEYNLRDLQQRSGLEQHELQQTIILMRQRLEAGHEPHSNGGTKSKSKKAPSAAELILQVAKTLAECPSLGEQLEKLIEITTRETHASRGTLFLNDPLTGELYSRVTQGGYKREIRILNTQGIAGSVFHSGQAVLCNDVYQHPKFDSTTDQNTGFKTKNMLCIPVTTMRGQRIGVAQAINKEGDFTQDELNLFAAILTHASIVLESTLFVEKMEQARQQEAEFLRVVSEVSSEIKLGPLLQKIMGAITRMLNCERSTLFVNDEKTNELYTEIGQGLGASKIRFPNHVGIAGTVFTSGRSVNIPYAYADLRFNPAFDKKTNFFTRSILCVPLVNKDGKVMGVTQILNKRGGPFTEDDETRLRAFTAQISIALENAKLFDDVQNTKNYNEGILQSMSNGVLTINAEDKIVTCNDAGMRIMKVREADVLKKTYQEFFTGPNAWVADRIKALPESKGPDVIMDKELLFGEEQKSINLTVTALKSHANATLGSMLLFEDISSEKRVKSTMSRYMDPSVADRLLGSGQDVLGGMSSESTVLFCDIRSFTTVTEELGAQGTVALLNEYFSIMVDCIQKEGGMLDKFIGDALMAVFGTPVPHDDDPDRAVRASIQMMMELEKWNAQRIAHGKKPVKIGIGINTGLIVSGNIGSPKRMDYTVIGDGANLASRLESGSKQYGANILISEETYKKLRTTYRTREVDYVIVQGKTQPVGVYEIMDFYNKDTFPNMRETLDNYKSGLEQYREGRFESAMIAFHLALEQNPKDKLSQVYIDRCRHYIKEPPGKDWDGVWKLTSK